MVPASSLPQKLFATMRSQYEGSLAIAYVTVHESVTVGPSEATVPGIAPAFTSCRVCNAIVRVFRTWLESAEGSDFVIANGHEI